MTAAKTYQRDRAYRLKRLYNITLDQYDAIKAAQGGTCAICGRAKGISTPLEVDHNHKTNEVRGLTCSRCNNRLGWLEARWTLIHEYLANPPARKVLNV